MPYIDDYREPDQVLTEADYKNAYHVASASNLSGVVDSMPEVISKIKLEAEAQGKRPLWTAQHPIWMIYLDKLAHLSGVLFEVTANKEYLGDAYHLVRQRAGV